MQAYGTDITLKLFQYIRCSVHLYVRCQCDYAYIALNPSHIVGQLYHASDASFCKYNPAALLAVLCIIKPDVRPGLEKLCGGLWPCL